MDSKYTIHKVNRRSKLFDSQYATNPQYLVRDEDQRIVEHFKGPHSKTLAEQFVNKSKREDNEQSVDDVSGSRDKQYWVLSLETDSEKIMSRTELIKMVGKDQFFNIMKDKDESFRAIRLE